MAQFWAIIHVFMTWDAFVPWSWHDEGHAYRWVHGMPVYELVIFSYFLFRNVKISLYWMFSLLSIFYSDLEEKNHLASKTCVCVCRFFWGGWLIFSSAPCLVGLVEKRILLWRDRGNNHFGACALLCDLHAIFPHSMKEDPLWKNVMENVRP